jgi:hypothetical protein
MHRAFLNLRFTVPERRAVFTEGLQRIGFEVVHGLTLEPREGDVLVTWNRIHEGETCAREFERRGNAVLVTENATWGNDFAGERWYTLARSYHNLSGTFPIGGNERWDSLGVELAPWREGGETVVLPSRGIGPACHRMPRDWPSKQSGRIRPHPGTGQAKRLCEDLAECGRVVTWGSGAAVQALMLGIPVDSHMPGWIAEQNNTDAGRLAMFRRLAHAQWRLEELRTGGPFARLLTAR